MGLSPPHGPMAVMAGRGQPRAGPQHPAGRRRARGPSGHPARSPLGASGGPDGPHPSRRQRQAARGSLAPSRPLPGCCTLRRFSPAWLESGARAAGCQMRPREAPHRQSSWRLCKVGMAAPSHIHVALLRQSSSRQHSIWSRLNMSRGPALGRGRPPAGGQLLGEGGPNGRAFAGGRGHCPPRWGRSGARRDERRRRRSARQVEEAEPRFACQRQDRRTYRVARI